MFNDSGLDRRAFLKRAGMTAVLGAVGARSASAAKMIGVQSAPVKQVPDFDILIENGMVVDGTGNPWFYADIGITDDSIVAVGDLASKTARKTIDAEGLVVSPGFIDVHAHSERGFGEPDSSANINYLIQGVTTVVTGNDGGGTFRVAETKMKWEALGIGTNAVHLVGFGAVR